MTNPPNTLTAAEAKVLVCVIANGCLPHGGHSRVWLDLIARDMLAVNRERPPSHGCWMVTAEGRRALATSKVSPL